MVVESFYHFLHSEGDVYITSRYQKDIKNIAYGVLSIYEVAKDMLPEGYYYIPLIDYDFSSYTLEIRQYNQMMSFNILRNSYNAFDYSIFTFNKNKEYILEDVVEGIIENLKKYSLEKAIRFDIIAYRGNISKNFINIKNQIKNKMNIVTQYFLSDYGIGYEFVVKDVYKGIYNIIYDVIEENKDLFNREHNNIVISKYKTKYMLYNIKKSIRSIYVNSSVPSIILEFNNSKEEYIMDVCIDICTFRITIPLEMKVNSNYRYEVFDLAVDSNAIFDLFGEHIYITVQLNDKARHNEYIERRAGCTRSKSLLKERVEDFKYYSRINSAKKVNNFFVEKSMNAF